MLCLLRSLSLHCEQEVNYRDSPGFLLAFSARTILWRIIVAI